MKKDSKGFEASLTELESILQAMSSEETSLEESIALYAKAAGLIQQANETLKTAQLRVDEIGKELAPWDELEAEPVP